MNKCHTGSDGNLSKFPIMHNISVKVPKSGNDHYNVTSATATITKPTAATTSITTFAARQRQGVNAGELLMENAVWHNKLSGPSAGDSSVLTLLISSVISFAGLQTLPRI